MRGETQSARPLGQLSFDALQGHAAREMRATVRLRCGACARRGVDAVQHDATQHPATNRGAIQYEAADGGAMGGGKNGMGWMGGWVRRANAWLDGWLVGLGLVMMELRRRKRKQAGSRRPCSGRSRASAGAGAGAGGAISSPGTWKFHFHFGTAAQPGHVANLDGSKLDGTAGSSPKLAGVGQACAGGRTSQPMAHLFLAFKGPDLEMRT